MLSGLVLLTTEAGWFAVHMAVQSVMYGAKPHQNDLLLQGQQVVFIPL